MAAYIAGELASWPTIEDMVVVLRDAGLCVEQGRHSLRISDCSHFVFQGYGGDLGDPFVDADADTIDEMMREGGIVSNALSRAKIRHRFEIYDDSGALSGYLHYQWPLEQDGDQPGG